MTRSVAASSSSGSTAIVTSPAVDRGLRRVEDLACEHVAARRAARHAALTEDGDDRRGDTDPHFAERERRRRRSDDDVGGRDEARAAGTDVSVESGDDRLRVVPELLEDLDERHGSDAGRGGARQVGTRTERVARAREHDAADGGVIRCCSKVRVELGEQLLRERVAVVGRVERDRRNQVVDLEMDELGVGHWLSASVSRSSRRTACRSRCEAARRRTPPHAAP